MHDLTGYAPEDLIQNRTISFASLIVAEDRPRVNDMVQHEITRFQPFQLEYRITDRSGRVRWVWEQGRGLFNNQGELVALEGYITDSSDRKRTEEALRQANKKLHLLPGITRHDINNQLTMLMGFLDLAKEAAGNHGPVCRYIGKGRKISDTIQQLIDMTQDYENIGQKEPTWQNMGDMFAVVVERRQLSGMMVEVETGDLEVFADPLLERVFFNLLDNTWRHGGQVSRIRLSCTVQEKKMVVIYEDDGEGIPVAEKYHIFERGFGKNTGLGLFLSREILSITGITITENGEPGVGAWFEITVSDGAYRVVHVVR